MPLQPVPETPKQSGSFGYYVPPKLKQASLAPLLARVAKGNTSGMSALPTPAAPSQVPYDATPRPGALDRTTIPGPGTVPAPVDCPKGCVDAAACGAYVEQVAFGTLVIAAVISGMAGAIGGYVLRSYLK